MIFKSLGTPRNHISSHRHPNRPDSSTIIGGSHLVSIGTLENGTLAFASFITSGVTLLVSLPDCAFGQLSPSSGAETFPVLPCFESSDSLGRLKLARENVIEQRLARLSQFEAIA